MHQLSRQDGPHETLERLAWAATGLSVVLTLGLARICGYSIAWGSTLAAVVGFAVMAGAAMVYARLRPEPRLRAGTGAMAQLIAFTAAAAPLSYIAAGFNLPLWDGTFTTWDQGLGYGWRGYFDAVLAVPGLHLLMRLAYIATLPMVVATILVLAATGRRRRLFAFNLALIYRELLVTIAVSGLMPALNAYNHAGLSPADHAGIDLPATTRHIAHLLALRDGSLRTLALDTAEGIITFPSLHTGLGILMIAALWPVRGLRIVALASNALMIAGTPVEGSHYLVDVLAGAAISAAGLCALLGPARSEGRWEQRAIAARARAAGRLNHENFIELPKQTSPPRVLRLPCAFSHRRLDPTGIRETASRSRPGRPR